MTHNEKLAQYDNMRNIYDAFSPEQRRALTDNDVRFVDRDSVYISGTNIIIGKGVRIGRNVEFICIGDTPCIIGDFMRVQSGTRVISSSIGNYCDIGGVIIDSTISDYVETGPHTELTRCFIGRNTTAKHYCYLGDTTTGIYVNIAANTITANYDGTYKNKTIIGDYVHTGISCKLISTKKNNNGLLRIGNNVLIGAGAIITKDVPDGVTVIGVNKIL